MTETITYTITSNDANKGLKALGVIWNLVETFDSINSKIDDEYEMRDYIDDFEAAHNAAYKSLNEIAGHEVIDNNPYDVIMETLIEL